MVVILLPFNEWCAARAVWGGKARAHYWATQDFANLQRATEAHWTMRRRHWPEHYLVECLADLSAELPAQRRRKRRKRTTRK